MVNPAVKVARAEGPPIRSYTALGLEPVEEMLRCSSGKELGRDCKRKRARRRRRADLMLSGSGRLRCKLVEPVTFR